MIKRVVATSLWFLAISAAGDVFAIILGAPRWVAPAAALSVAAVVWFAFDHWTQPDKWLPPSSLPQTSPPSSRATATTFDG